MNFQESIMHFSLASYNSPLLSRIFPIQKADKAFWENNPPSFFVHFFITFSYVVNTSALTYLSKYFEKKIKLVSKEYKYKRAEKGCDYWTTLRLRPRVYHWIPRGFKFPLILICLRVNDTLYKKLKWNEKIVYEICKKIPSGIDKFF